MATADIDLAAKFPSDSMWGMIYEAGLEPENDVPSYRPSLGRVPSFSKLIDQNGPLFAAKINRSLGRMFGLEVGRNFAFIHPDEDAANSLASCVWELAALGSIPVRSRLIELAEFVRTAPELIERARNDSPEFGEYVDDLVDRWKAMARNSSAGSYTPFRVVLLSEFRASGKRLRGLGNLSKIFGWEVLGSISLASMYPLKHDFHDRCFSFYQFGYMSVGGEIGAT